MKSRAEQFFLFSVAMTAVFAALMFWSAISGETIVNTNIPESVFSQEEVKDAPIRFELKEASPLTMTVESPKLDNSWLWVKTVILDSEDLVVHEHSFDLSYYYGRDWSEGSRDSNWTFLLPAGTYKILVYGENQRTSKPSQRIKGDNLVKVELQSGVVLMRYFFLGFIAFAILSFVANKRKKEALSYQRAESNRRELFS